MKRGRILFCSVLFEILAIVGITMSLQFLTISLRWKGLILFGGVSGMIVFAFLLVYFWWASNNLFFTFVPEGRAKIVVRGDAARKTLIQWRGHRLAEKKTGDIDVGDVIKDPAKKESFWGGLIGYGWYPLDDIYLYDFSWSNIDQSGQPVLHPKEAMDYILLKDDVYLAKIKEAEDKELIPVDVDLVLTIGIVNPYKALFCIQNWLETTINWVDPATRDCITRDTFENWIQEPKDLGEEIFARLKDKKTIEELRNSYGVALKAIGVKDINPSGNFRELTVKKVTAEKQREVILVEADAEKQRIATVYRQIKRYGDTGKLLRTLEALEKSPGQGAKWIIPLPGMAELFSQVFPGRTLETLTPEDIKSLKEMIEKLNQSKQRN